MTTRRTAKASRAIKEVVSQAILFELNDPRVKDVTVLDVEVAPDMRSAKVYVSIMGAPKSQDLTLHGLNSARGFLQKRLSDRIDTRYTPILSFVVDDSVKKSIEAAQILRKIADERGEQDPDFAANEGDVDVESDADAGAEADGDAQNKTESEPSDETEHDSFPGQC